MIISILIAFSILIPESASEVFGVVQSFVSDDFGWLLILIVNLLLGTCIYLAFTRIGEVRIGGRHAKPEFNRLTWFSMLFGAGMGIGLLFYGVAEPIMHFSNAPSTAFSNPDAALPRGVFGNAQHAMGLTYLHWGLHAWGIYAIIGLALAFITFNRKKPLSIGAFLKSAYPKTPRVVELGVDVLAIVATVCGVAASLGFGASQINAGLELLFGIEQSGASQAWIIAAVTLLATISVALGLGTGIRRLSELNLSLAVCFALIVFIVGPTVFLLDGFVQNLGYYAQRFIYLSTWTETYSNDNWQGSWTVFYWAWWVSWSPFVGIFIARISYGRSVREFIFGVLLVPTLFTFAWMTIFGDSALHIELFGNGGLSEAVNASMPDAMFSFLANYPFATALSALAIVIVVIFFVTSADSGALVTAMIASGGSQEASFGSRVTWAILIGCLAAALLGSGGYGALQSAALLTGLPFALVLMAMAFGLIRLLGQESRRLEKVLIKEAEDEQEARAAETPAD